MKPTKHQFMSPQADLKVKSPDKPHESKIKDLKVPDDLCYVPSKILNFQPNTKLNLPALSSLTFKPTISNEHHSITQRKYSEPILSDNKLILPPNSPKLSGYSHSNYANELLRSDRKQSKIDFLKKPKDISYLLETKAYAKEEALNEYFIKTITHSTNLLSPKNHASLMNKSMNKSMYKSEDHSKGEIISASFQRSVHPRSPEPLPTSMNQLKAFVTNPEYEEDRSAKEFNSFYNEKSVDMKTVSPKKIVDAVSAGYELNDYIGIKQNEIKEGLKKVKERVVIQHRSQNMKLAIPSGRKEVIALSDWLNNMLEKIYKEETIETKQIFEDVQLIYTACLQEIIRQVKIQCGERGQLLDKIWEAYIDLFDRVIQEHTRAMKEIERYYLDETDEVHKMYQKRLEQTKLELEDNKRQRDESNALLDTKKEQLKFLKKKTDKLDSELRNNRLHTEEILKELERTKAENMELNNLMITSGIDFGIKYADLQKKLDIKYQARKGVKKLKKEQILEHLFDPLRDKNLYENLDMIDKLEGALNQEDVMEGLSEEEREVDADEELYKEIGVDTQDLIERVEMEVQVEDVNPDENIEQLDENGQQNESEIYMIKEEGYEEGENNDKEEHFTKDNFEETSEDKNEIELTSEKNSIEPHSLSIGEEKKNEDLLNLIKQIGEMKNKELFEMLHMIEFRLQKSLQEETDATKKSQLARLLLILLRSRLGFRFNDYKALLTQIIGERNMAMHTPLISRENLDDQKLNEIVGGLDKESLLQILEEIHAKIERKVGDKSKTKESDELVRILLSILRENINDTTLKKDLRISLFKLFQGGHSRDGTEDRLDFVDVIESNIEESLRDIDVGTMNKDDKTKFLEEIKKKLDEDIGMESSRGVDREMILFLKKFIKTREDLTNKEYEGLMNKLLGAFDRGMSRMTELKIENDEMLIDVQELNEEKDMRDLRIEELEKELAEYRNRTRYTEKQNEKLQSKFKTLKSSLMENNKFKMEKLTSLMISLNKSKTLQQRESLSALEFIKGEPSPLKSPLTGKMDYEAELVVSNVASLSEENQAGEFQEAQNRATADMLIDNIANIIQEELVREIDEDEWSDGDDFKGSSGRFKLENSPNMRHNSVRGLKFPLPVCKVPGPQNRRGSGVFSSITRAIKAKNILRVTSANMEGANALLAKVKEKGDIISGLPKLTVLKFIGQIYFERLKVSGNLKQTPLHLVIYDYFMNKYGLKKVAENKCQQMFESVLYHSSNRRIQRFRDFLGLGETYDADELDFYFSTLKLFDPMGGGTHIASSLTEKNLVLLENAEAAANALFEKKVDPPNLKALISILNENKCSEKTTKPMIEFEDAMEEFLSIQRVLQKKVKGFVRDIFSAADLDNDEIIEFFEFDILYKHVEKERYDKETVKKLFFQEADMMIPECSNEKVVSFNKFAWICLELGLFSEEKQQDFSKVVDPTDKVQSVQNLEDNLKERLNEIRLRFIKSKTYNVQLKGIMTKLYNSVKNPLKPRHVVWLTYRLLDEESKFMLLNYEIKRMLPTELLAISKFVENYEDWSYNDQN